MKIVKIALSILISLNFIACSNMTIGLEEDSRFYNGPIYDNREDAVSENTSPKKAETKISEHVPEVKTPDKTVEPKRVEKTEEKSSENETTFSYERDDE